jgi:hypothetical protein
VDDVGGRLAFEFESPVDLTKADAVRDYVGDADLAGPTRADAVSKYRRMSASVLGSVE